MFTTYFRKSLGGKIIEIRHLFSASLSIVTFIVVLFLAVCWPKLVETASVLKLDCYDLWANCIADLQLTWQFENQDWETGVTREETPGDTMVMHYECVNSTVSQRADCQTEVTDGVCNAVDRETAVQMGSQIVRDLETYCENWGLKI